MKSHDRPTRTSASACGRVPAAAPQSRVPAASAPVAGSPASKQCPANRIRRSAVSPAESRWPARAARPRPPGRRARAPKPPRRQVLRESRGRRRSRRAPGGELAAPSRRTTSARRRCVSLRCAGEASVYTPLASRGWASRISVALDKDDAVALGGLEDARAAGHGRRRSPHRRARPSATPGTPRRATRHAPRDPGCRIPWPGPTQPASRAVSAPALSTKRASQFDGVERISG